MESKFKRPAKTADGWPGVVKLNFKHPGLQYPFKFYCPQPLCFYHIVAADETTLNVRIETHPCPWHGGGTTTFSWGVMSDTYLQPIWEMLDRQVDILKGAGADTRCDDEVLSDMRTARHQARGMAEALAILMPPFFTTGDEIVREALVRWENRQAGIDYETPGIGRFKFQRPPGMTTEPDDPSWVTKPEYIDDGQRAAPKPRAKPTVRAEPKPAEKTKDQLTAEEITKIKAAAAFPVRMLASAYGVSETVIKEVQGV
jgi:hypothetical protein